jgi:hypothetical protein
MASPSTALLLGEVTFDVLSADPLQILRVQRRALTHPVLLDFVCRIITVAMEGTVRLAAKHLAAENPAHAEFSRALQLTLRTTLIQTLLSLALPVQPFEAFEYGAQAPVTVEDTFVLERRQVVCAFVHLQIMSDPDVARLLLHQGVPLAILPLLYQDVPSMHISSTFLGSLLEEPAQPMRQSFAVVATAYLNLQYPLPSNLDLANVSLVRRLNYLLFLLTIALSDAGCYVRLCKCRSRFASPLF